MTPTITPEELGKLQKARAVQVAEYRAEWTREFGTAPIASDPRCIPSLANVSIDGVETAVNLGRLVGWARTWKAGTRLAVGYEDGKSIRLETGGASVRLVCWPEHVALAGWDRFNNRKLAKRELLGAVIRIEQDPSGALAVDFGPDRAARLKELRIVAGEMRRARMAEKAPKPEIPEADPAPEIAPARAHTETVTA